MSKRKPTASLPDGPPTKKATRNHSVLSSVLSISRTRETREEEESLATCAPITEDEEEATRKEYLNLVNDQTHTLDSLTTALLHGSEEEYELCSINVPFSLFDTVGKTQSDETTTSLSVSTLGRRTGCTIETPDGQDDRHAISRIQCLLLAHKEEGVQKLTIVDFFSFTGTRVYQDKQTFQSLPKDRRVITVDPTKPFSISPENMAVSVLFNPKWCLVCMTKPRIVVVDDCNHMAMCTDCRKRVHKCPICNETITTDHVEHNRLETYIQP